MTERFSSWCERMLGYDFVVNRDYILVSQKRSTNNPFTSQTDYALTISCAKEIAMIQRGGKGKQIRNYSLVLPAHVGKAFCL